MLCWPGAGRSLDGGGRVLVVELFAELFVRPDALRSLVSSAVVALVLATLTQVSAGAVPVSVATQVAPAAAGEKKAEKVPVRHHRDKRHVNRNHRHQLRVGTYNLRAAMGLRKFREGVRSIRRHADVVGLQEIGANRRRHFLNASKRWGYHRPRYIQQNPVIWDRRKFRKVDAGAQRIARSRHLRGQLPGSHERKKHSTATVVRLRHRSSGRRISVVNVHLVHGAVKGGRPWPHRPRVFNLFVDQVRGLVRTVRSERRWGRVFVVGDFNAGYRADAHYRLPRLPYRQLRRLRLNSMWQGTNYVRRGHGTHRDALIDQVWSKRKPARAKILRWIEPSDHYPAVATYRLRSARRHH